MSHTYITTPIYYVNGDPHIGHAHSTITADALKRLAMMRGHRVYMTTGTDEHGQKNQEAAEASGLPTREYLDRQSGRFRALFDELDVSYDLFVRTTAPTHVAAVTEMLRRLWESGHIVKKLYRGLYCVGCEQFKRPSDLDAMGRCPDHLVVPVESEELNYFLVLGPFQEWLVDHLTAHEDLIQPAYFRREILAMLGEPLEDLSISRPKSRVTLGIELPFDREYVTYVWFDALINYVSSIGWPADESRFRGWWPVAAHLMAKDIIKTHCIYWPIMLRALGLQPPARYLVHGYWVGEGGRKMSKSLGNAIDPGELRGVVGSDGVRYYLLKNMATGDATIATRLVVQTYNTDLANTVGNLFSRVLKFVAPEAAIPDPGSVHGDDARVLGECVEIAIRVHATVGFETLHLLPRGILEIATRLNAHVDSVAPWRLSRDSAQRERLESVIYAVLEGLRVLAELAWPVMPGMSDRALRALGASPVTGGREHRFSPFELPRGGVIPGMAGPLFPRVQDGEGQTGG